MMKTLPEEIKNVIEICCKNIKGLTKIEDIDNLLPIKTNVLNIEKIGKKIVISNQNEILGNVWQEVGCYSNLNLLKAITKEYNIEPKNERILELMKYKYKIDNMLLKVG